MTALCCMPAVAAMTVVHAQVICMLLKRWIHLWEAVCCICKAPGLTAPPPCHCCCFACIQQHSSSIGFTAIKCWLACSRVAPGRAVIQLHCPMQLVSDATCNALLAMLHVFRTNCFHFCAFIWATSGSAVDQTCHMFMNSFPSSTASYTNQIRSRRTLMDML